MSDSSEMSDTELEGLVTVKRRKVSPSRDKNDKSPKRAVRLELRADAGAEQLLAAVDSQLEKLDSRLVKLLAWQQLQQVSAPNITFGITNRLCSC